MPLYHTIICNSHQVMEPVGGALNCTLVANIVLARDPPSRHFGRVFGYFGRFGQAGSHENTFFLTGDSQKLPKIAPFVVK